MKQPTVVATVQHDYNTLHKTYERQALQLAQQKENNSRAEIDAFLLTQEKLNRLRDSAQRMISRHVSTNDANDTNYIFLHFVKNSLPVGLVGLLFAVIFLASWGSISAALNSLAASSLMDVQLLAHKIPPSEEKQLWLGRMHTLVWGVFCIGTAMFASRMGSLIEAVNILGSLFYGTILGIFLVAFYVKKVKGDVVFVAAIITEVFVVGIYLMDIVSFLWLNAIGALLLVLICLGATAMTSRKEIQN